MTAHRPPRRRHHQDRPDHGAVSGQSARAGESLTRGMTVAIDEINAKGGLLGGTQAGTGAP